MVFIFHHFLFAINRYNLPTAMPATRYMEWPEGAHLPVTISVLGLLGLAINLTRSSLSVSVFKHANSPLEFSWIGYQVFV